jgi:hypothetical protein
MNTPVAVTFRLSQLSIVRKYVETHNRLLSLHVSLEEVIAAIAPLQAVEAAAHSRHTQEQAKLRALQAEAKILCEAKEKEVFVLESIYEDATPWGPPGHYRLGEVPYSPYECRPGTPAADAWEMYRSATEEMKQVRNDCRRSTTKADEASTALDEARKSRAAADCEKRTAERHALEAEIQLAALGRQLPAGALNLSIGTLADVGTIDTQRVELTPWRPEGSSAEIAGMIRGELPTGCGGYCVDGYIRVWLEQPGIHLIVDDQIRHSLCYQVAHFDHERLVDTVPKPHENHRLHSLRPWERSPIPVRVQADIIMDVPSCSENLNGWLMVGAAGTSKTTYAAAAVVDMLTFRIAQNPSTTPLNYWRLKVPKWTRDMEAFEQRPFGDRSIPEPSTTPHMIEVMTRKSGLAPILWLEELDKFNPTVNRLRNLYCLIDAVYECGGTIISTSNMRLKELKEHLGEPIYRRLSGENDSPEKFKVWDFWRASPKGSPAVPSPAPKQTSASLAPGSANSFVRPKK